MTTLCNLCDSSSKGKLISCIRCKKIYHKICYDKWLKTNANSELLFYCPDCSFCSFNEEGISFLYEEEIDYYELKEDSENKCCSCNYCIIL